VSDERWLWKAHGLLRADDGRVLVLADGAGVRVPYVEAPFADGDELSELRAAFAMVFGARTAIVRSVAQSVDEKRKEYEVGVELEALSPVEPPGDASWLGPNELATSRLPARDRDLLEALFTDVPHALRPPWARRGWFAEASSWIERALAKRGRAALGPVEQLSNWCISSILRVSTDEGDVFFKATARSPLFVDEGVVTRGLAELFPTRIPRVIAVDPERSWMLLEDFGPVVGWGASADVREAVLTDYVGLQIETAIHVDELLALGVFDRRQAWLAAQLETLRDEPDALGLDDAELERLAARLPQYLDACERLAAGPIPSTLVHGDLHLANVAGTSAPYVYFDWTDAAIAHPFLDPLAIHSEKDPVISRDLRDAYLSGWRDYADESVLTELWSLAVPLTFLNQAISYRSILANVEPGSAAELAPALPEWLRRALAAGETAC
jgi:hypothetical protein